MKQGDRYERTVPVFSGNYITEPEEEYCSYSDDNYTVNWVMGDPVKLTVTPASITISVTGHTDTKTYNGSEQSVTGYDARCGSGLFDGSRISFSGEAIAKGTEVSDDKYMMGLKEDQFSYDDDNVKARFEITDGWLKIIEGETYTLTDPVLPKADPADDPGQQERPPVPTNQEDLPKITTREHYYEIYQIFTGDYTQFTTGEGEEAAKEDVLTNLVWGQNGSDPDKTVSPGDPVDQTIIDALKAVVGAELDRTKLDEIEKYVVLDGNPYATITLGPGDTESHMQLPSGYYLIRDREDSQTGRFDAYTTYITVVIKDYTIQPKSVIPTVDKQVYEDSDGGAHREGWTETADHAMNETFQFALIGTIPENPHLKDYTEGYIVKFTDTMSEGVTFEDIAYVTVNDAEVPSELYTFDYTEESTAADNAGNEPSGGASGTPADSGADASAEEPHHTLTITMDLKEILGNSFGSGGISVVVVYNAHLNEKAVTHVQSAESTTTNNNTVYMEYSNNPNTSFSADRGRTAVDTVWVFTYEVNVQKTDENRKPLAGAGFTLFRGDEPVELVKDSTDSRIYYVAAQTETEQPGEAETVREIVTDSTGLIYIKGLDLRDSGDYVLRETTVPAGYNEAGDTTISITASHEENIDRSTVRLDLYIKNGGTVIINQSGSTLPSTGGPGTQLFYLIGLCCILGAAGIKRFSRHS